MRLVLVLGIALSSFIDGIEVDNMLRKRRYLIKVSDQADKQPASAEINSRRELETSQTELEEVFRRTLFTSDMSMVAIPIENADSFTFDFKTQLDEDHPGIASADNSLPTHYFTSDRLKVSVLWWSFWIPSMLLLLA